MSWIAFWLLLIIITRRGDSLQQCLFQFEHLIQGKASPCSSTSSSLSTLYKKRSPRTSFLLCPFQDAFLHKLLPLSADALAGVKLVQSVLDQINTRHWYFCGVPKQEHVPEATQNCMHLTPRASHMINKWKNERMSECVNGWINKWMSERMNEWTQ